MKTPATLVVCRDPFRPLLNREVRKVRRGTRIDTLLRQQKLLRGNRRTCRYVVLHNRKAVLQADWNRKVDASDVVEVVYVPAGGGGGGSNAWQAVLTIALVVLSIWVPGALGFAAGTWQAAAISGAILIGGSMLVNSMFPPPGLDVGSVTREQASPNYTINAQNNSARLLEAIPVLYGRFRSYPDLAAYPFTENWGNQQYLYQLLCITQGRIDHNTVELRIEDTPFSSFSEVQYEIIDPGRPVTLFPTNVVTSNAVQNLSMDKDLVLGPFVVNAAGTTCNALAVDIVLPGGLAQINNRGGLDPWAVSWRFEYQEINNNGSPTTGMWYAFEERVVQLATEDPQMLTYKAPVPPGRYQVRGYRTSNQGDSSRTRDAIQWGSLRGYLTAPHDYGNVTLLAVVMKATNNLNSNIARRINVTAQRLLPTWDPVNGWGPEVPTRNPAWVVADILRNEDYGRGLGTSRINIQELFRLAAVWEVRGDQFNGIFDTTSQLWDALTKACRVGRAVPLYYAGLVDFVRNEPKSLPTAMFQPANMTKGSFSTEYQFTERDSPDHVIIEYTNEATWQPAQVECALPGSAKRHPANVSFFGVTNRDQAWREGMSMAAANRDQRRLITFTTEQEGLLVRFGDLVQVSHDVVAWGYSGRVVSMDPMTGDLVASEPLPFSPGESHVIAFRRRDGSMHGPFNITPGPSGDPFQAKVSGATSTVYISDGEREERTHYQFGPVNRAGLKCLVRSGAPTNDGKVALTLVNYADSVHGAENGGLVPPPPPASNLPKRPTLPIVDKVTLEYTFAPGHQKIVATAANGASYYEFEIRHEDSPQWASIGTAIDPYLNVALSPGYWYVRVRAVGAMAGPWATWEGEVLSSTLPLPTIALLSASRDRVMQINVVWVFDEATNTGTTGSVEVWVNTSNNLSSAQRLGVVAYPGNTLTMNNIGHGDRRWFFARCVNTIGQAGPWYNNGVGIEGQATSDASIILGYLTGEITESQLGQALLSRIENAEEGATVEVQEIKNELAAMYTIKTQLAYGNRRYIAGIGVGVENNNGIINSQVLVAANRFAVIDPNGEAAIAPFVIDRGNVYINTAYIGNATITSAMIHSLEAYKISTNSLSAISANLGTITAGWLQNPTGSVVMNLNATGNQQVLRVGSLRNYGPLLGMRYAFELFADGYVFFGREGVGGGTIRSSGRWTLAPQDAPCVLFRSTYVPPTDPGGA